MLQCPSVVKACSAGFPEPHPQVSPACSAAASLQVCRLGSSPPARFSPDHNIRTPGRRGGGRAAGARDRPGTVTRCGGGAGRGGWSDLGIWVGTGKLPGLVLESAGLLARLQQLSSVSQLPAPDQPTRPTAGFQQPTTQLHFPFSHIAHKLSDLGDMGTLYYLVFSCLKKVTKSSDWRTGLPNPCGS